MGSRRKNSSAVEILFCRISTSLPPALIRPFQFVLCPYFFCSSDLKKADLAANTCPHLGGVNQGGGFQSPHRAFFIHHIAAWLRALCSRHELWFTGEFSCVTDFEMRSFSDCSLFLLLTRYCHGGGTCRSLRRKEDRRTSTNVYCRRLNERHRRTSYGFYFCLSCAADPAKFDARTTSYVTNDVTLFQSDFVRKRTAEKKTSLMTLKTRARQSVVAITTTTTIIPELRPILCKGATPFSESFTQTSQSYSPPENELLSCSFSRKPFHYFYWQRVVRVKQTNQNKCSSKNRVWWWNVSHGWSTSPFGQLSTRTWGQLWPQVKYHFAFIKSYKNKFATSYKNNNKLMIVRTESVQLLLCSRLRIYIHLMRWHSYPP